jgi:hypothetical protein
MRLLFLLVLAAHAGAADYYVSTKGKDTNPGTLAQPWRTIQKAADTLAPGDTAWVRQGRYRERVTVNVSGTGPDQFVNFRVYPRERAYIDGSRLVVPDEDNTALVLVLNHSFVRVQGFHICNYRATRGDRTPIGVLITGECDHVEIRDNNIFRIRYRAKNGNALGLLVYGNSAASPISHVIIDGNEIHHCQLGNSESLTLNGNVVDSEVTNNRIHDNDNIGIDFAGFEETCPDPAQDQARDCICRGNVVWNIRSYGNPAYGRHFSAGGIYVDGGTRILIEKNITHHCDIGIELASEHLGRATSHVVMRENVLHHNRIGGLFLGGYDEQRGSTTDCFIHHNTFFENDTRRDGNGELYLEHFVTNNTITHNLFAPGRQSLLIGNAVTTNSGNLLDYNLYFAPAGEADSDWQWKNVTSTGFAAYQNATGNDTHSLFGDPLFLNRRKSDFHLAPNSPAIDAGDASFTPANGETDLDGTPRINGLRVDIGADES